MINFKSDDGDYIYEVELLVLNDFKGKNSVVYTDDFKRFVEEDVNRFNTINDLILTELGKKSPTSKVV